MDQHTVSKSEWSLTREALAKFLSCLDPDADRAGEQYEALRLTLIKFFDWRGAPHPEDHADETLNRVIRQIDQGETIRDIPTWCHGVARMVFLEKLKSRECRNTSLEEILPAQLTAPEAEPEDSRQECFHHCLYKLEDDHRRLILRYYSDDKRAKINNRLALAQSLGLPLNALRSRAQRIRDKLEQCIKNCLAKR